MMTKQTIWNIPVGGDRRYLVTCDGKPFAGFDTRAQASMYVTMQKNKTKSGGQPAAAADKNWEIKDKKKSY
jgi:hypothetical protein